LHYACNGEFGTELLCILHVAAAAGLQIAAMRCSIDFGNVEQTELAGLLQLPAQLIADTHQPVTLVSPRTINLPLEARIQ
jgi:hypothetical protein